jgi:hypothetical protein
VVASVIEDKWMKTREIILDPGAVLGAEKLSHKRLERVWGSLICVSHSYKWMTPYLKGLYLTI